MPLQVKDLCVGYRGHTVLSGLSLSAGPGVTGILGRNGCGKTTLFRALAGMLTPESGEILWGGSALPGSARKRAKLLAFMQQGTSAAAGIRAIDYIEMGFYAAKGPFFSPGAKEHERVKSLAASYGCGELLYRPMEAMSAGERQMTALLAAAVQDTPLLLLDEPTSALDYNHTHTFLSALRTLAKTDGKTVLAVLHDPSLALRYCGRIAVLDGGGVYAVFEPEKETPEHIRELLLPVYPGIRVGRAENEILCF